MVANGMEGVPWMISGADHSADIGRVLAYAATNGVSGVISPNDLKVSQSGTANMQVHVGVGALAIVNKSGVQSQSYVGRATAVSDLTVATTGSSARSDLVVVRIKDPQFAPWQGLYTADTDIANGPYAFPEIIPGVPANTVRAEQLNLPQSLYAVARLDLPANTTTGVTSGMIKDLRSIVNPQYVSANDLQRAATGTTKDYVSVASTTAWFNWPSATAVTVDIPSWATHCDAEITVLGWKGQGPSLFDTRISLGALLSPTQRSDYNGSMVSATNLIETLQHSVFGEFDVTALAGTTQTMRLQAIRIADSGYQGGVYADSSTQVRFRVEFYQRPY